MRTEQIWRITFGALLITAIASLSNNQSIAFAINSDLNRLHNKSILRRGVWQCAPTQICNIDSPTGYNKVEWNEKAVGEQTSIDQKTQADQLLQRGVEQYRHEQIQDAVQSWQQALELYRQAQDQPGEGSALVSLGAAYVTLERYRDAVNTLELYMPIARSLNDRRGEAQASGNLGIAYEALGNYGRSIAVLKQAGKLMLTLGDRSGLGRVLLNLGNTFEAVGDYDNAKIAYEQSLKIAQQMGNSLQLSPAEKRQQQGAEGIALSNLGSIYANLGQYQDAIAAFEKSLAIARSTENYSSQASALLNLGSAYHSLRDRAKALNYYQQALKAAQLAKESRLEGDALGSLGLIYEDLKQYPKAIDYFQKSLAIARKAGNPEIEGIALNNLGHAFLGAGKLQDAETQLQSAIKLLDALRPGLSDTYKVSIFDTQIHTYNLLQQILIAAKKPESALEAAEQGRARAFVEMLARRVTNSQPGSKPDTAESSNFAASTNLSVAQLKQIARQQNATLVEYAIVPDDDFKFRGKQRARESELYIWVVQPDGKVDFQKVDLKPLWQKNITLTDVVQVARCLAPGEDCGAVAEALRDLKVGRSTNQPTNPTTPSADKPRTRKQIGLRKLYDILIAPIVHLLPKDASDRVIFIPQETLFLVPFAALQDSDGSYLIQNHTVLTAPSIQVLALTHHQRLKQSPLSSPSSQSPPTPPPATRHPTPLPSLVIGNPTMPKVVLTPGQPAQTLAPLPGSEQEAIKVASLLQTKALIGSAATKEAVTQKLSTAQIIHLATHGLLEYGSQGNYVSLEGLGVPGAIALAPTSHDDGLLTADEILNLQLQANLVVLSACNTGKGRINGDGVIGLSRAFILAGTPSVIVSLWEVPDDPTAELMTSFYQNLKQQPDKAIALRQAMLETMQDFPRPLDWAAFTLIGEAE